MNKAKLKKSRCSTSTQQKSGSLHLTKKVDYGIFLLLELSKQKPGTSLSVKTVSEENRLSFTFLQKIAGLLLKARIIEAERGKYGGYTLAKNPKNLTLRDIIEALEGPIFLTPCLKAPCKRDAVCRVKPQVAKINDEIRQYLMGKKLSSFIS